VVRCNLVCLAVTSNWSSTTWYPTDVRWIQDGLKVGKEGEGLSLKASDTQESS